MNTKAAISELERYLDIVKEKSSLPRDNLGDMVVLCSALLLELATKVKALEDAIHLPLPEPENPDDKPSKAELVEKYRERIMRLYHQSEHLEYFDPTQILSDFYDEMEGRGLRLEGH
jgi:hypothetical protein